MTGEIEVAPLRLKTAIRGWVIIYGLTIVTNFILNAWMKAMPIGPWTGEDIQAWYWFDNVCYMLCSLWWCFFFVAVGNWPFSKIEDGFKRGLVATVACWVIGWFSYKAIYWIGLDAGWAFPIIGSAFFLLVLFSYTCENWFMGGFSPPRQFGLLLLLIIAFTWLLTNTAVRWVPPWWFPFCQMGLATGLFAYLFRKMNQPMKGIFMWLLMFALVGLWLFISKLIGIWDVKNAGVSAFWNIGLYDNNWLLLFFAACSFVYGVLVPPAQLAVYQSPHALGRHSGQSGHGSPGHHCHPDHQRPDRECFQGHKLRLHLRLHGGGLVLFYPALFRHRVNGAVSVDGTKDSGLLGRRGLNIEAAFSHPGGCRGGEAVLSGSLRRARVVFPGRADE